MNSTYLFTLIPIPRSKRAQTWTPGPAPKLVFTLVVVILWRTLLIWPYRVDRHNNSRLKPSTRERLIRRGSQESPRGPSAARVAAAFLSFTIAGSIYLIN